MICYYSKGLRKKRLFAKKGTTLFAPWFMPVCDKEWSSVLPRCISYTRWCQCKEKTSAAFEGRRSIGDAFAGDFLSGFSGSVHPCNGHRWFWWRQSAFHSTSFLIPYTRFKNQEMGAASLFHSLMRWSCMDNNAFSSLFCLFPATWPLACVTGYVRHLFLIEDLSV